MNKPYKLTNPTKVITFMCDGNLNSVDIDPEWEVIKTGKTQTGDLVWHRLPSGFETYDDIIGSDVKCLICVIRKNVTPVENKGNNMNAKSGYVNVPYDPETIIQKDWMYWDRELSKWCLTNSAGEKMETPSGSGYTPYCRPDKENKVVDIRHLAQPTNNITLKDIPAGTFFYWENVNDTTRQLYLKTADTVIMVTRPQVYWNSAGTIFLNYRPVAITISVDRYL
jgi:hypothetical protein